MTFQKIIFTSLLFMMTQFILGQNSINPFEENGKWGFTNGTNKIIVEPQYEFAKSLSKEYGVAFQRENKRSIDIKAIVIDSLGKIIIGPKYRKIEYLGDNLFEVWK